MKLVTFGINKDRNLIIQFPVFEQPYTQQLLKLYQIERAPVSIVDQNKHANSYTYLQIDRPYIALNSETYILIRRKNSEHAKRLDMNFTVKNFFW